MSPSKSLVVLAGGEGTSPIERLVAAARRAIAIDTIERLWSTGLLDLIVVVTDDEELSDSARRLGATVETSGTPFHFGTALLSCVRRHAPDSVLYVGSGTLSLAEDADLRGALQWLDKGPVVAGNNLYSADVVAFSPAGSVERIDPPDTDNDLAWRLYHGAGLPFVQFPPSLGFVFDVDTPSDLALLQLWRPASQRLGLNWESASLPTSTIGEVMKVMADPAKQLLVAGRVSLQVWRDFQNGTACSTRLLCEERGMRASGRLARGEAKSVLGFLAQMGGFAGFFGMLEQMCDAAIIDTRVLFAHLGLAPTRRDRYAADALLVDEIRDPTIRELTRSAAASRIPILMGGHSLVSGGLLLLLELGYHWRARETAGVAFAEVASSGMEQQFTE